MKNLAAALTLLILLVACNPAIQTESTLSGTPSPKSEHASWPRIYLHFDYMVADGHDHGPSAEAMEMVVEAFKKNGIILDIDPIHNAIPESMVTTLVPNIPACTGADSVDLSTLKAEYYVPRNEHEYYGLFAHYNTCGDPQSCQRCPATLYTAANPPFGTSGIARFSGHDFIVSLGTLVDMGLDPMPSILDAGTLMHELGHNLGLRHGGGDDLNQKPNYISAMNYSYQFGIGIDRDHRPIVDDSIDPSEDYIVNYSGEVLPTLNEGMMGQGRCVPNGKPGPSEMQGVIIPDDYVMVFFDATGGNTSFTLGDGSPIDWDGDGEISNENAYGDLSADGQCNELHGFDDWAFIKAYLENEKA